METYNSEYVLETITLTNSGVLCYLNSLTQALFSLPAFNKTLLDREDKYIQNKNELALEFVKMFKEFKRSAPGSKTINSTSLDTLLAKLIQRRKMFARGMPMRIGSQEDADEGFHILLNSLDGDLSNLDSDSSANIIERQFHIRYDTIINCRKCGSKRLAGNEDHLEPPEVVIHIPEHDDLIGNIDSQEAMQNYINKRSEFPAGYKCEKCGACNVGDAYDIVKQTILRRLSSVVVVGFKNYPSYTKSGKKILHYFPPVMEFKSKNGKLTYRAVAKIEHFGNERGGHYIAYCQRLVHPAVHERHIDTYKKAAERAKDDDERRKQLKRRIRLATGATTDVFKMDDSRISYADGIKPSENTYMVFYHLQ